MIFGKNINRYYIKYAFPIFLGLVTLVVIDYVQLIIPNLYQMLINGINTGTVEVDGVSVPFNTDFLLDRICMPLVWVILCMAVGRFLWRICFFGSAIKLETDLRNRMFDHAKDLSQEYYQVHKVGHMMSLFTNDLSTVQECFGSGILMLCDAVILGGLAIFKMWRMDPMLTCLALIPMALLLAISALIGRYMMKKWDVRQEAFSRLSDFSQESFSGIAVIKAFVKEGKELWAFKKLNLENEKANVEHTRASALLHILVTLFVESVICVILGYGGFLVYRGSFNAGELMEFIGYFTTTVWPVMAVSELIDLTSRGKASLKRIDALLDQKPTVTDRKGVKTLENAKGKIEFRSLTFRYPGSDATVLKDVSFVIEAGENVGLVGKTGSGKTTVVDLILRTYNVPDESIFVDGHDVNSVSIRSLRNACAYVPQDNFLFSDTIASNIAFGVSGVDEATVKEAARLSDVDGNIEEFTNGYQTVLGERGVTVSGGQKQRISIARALLKNSPILILDDSVSAVDTGTEKTILQNLRATRRGKTTILIAHRVSTIKEMDKIIFIDNGSILAVGSHEELYATSAEYKKMVDLQTLEEEGGEYSNA